MTPRRRLLAAWAALTLAALLSAAEPAPEGEPMRPLDDRANERWADLFGNYYSSAFITGFSYSATTPDGPSVRVTVAPTGPTLRGRLVARHLKPHFIYQVKLRGDYARDPEGHRLLGLRGRFRLPGRETNYTAAEALAYPRPEQVESYLLFDYFVTDAAGNADLAFAAEHSFHVVWRSACNRVESQLKVRRITGDFSDPRCYAIPKAAPRQEVLWAELCKTSVDDPTRLQLPARTYHAELLVTEESMHSYDADGGWWATVYGLPISFTIQP
jgi:hypothetical protein